LIEPLLDKWALEKVKQLIGYVMVLLVEVYPLCPLAVLILRDAITSRVLRDCQAPV
jgi:hypothetical protein